MRKCLFLHVAKTAGTSVYRYLLGAYERKNVLKLRYQDGSLSRCTSSDIGAADFIWLHEPLFKLPGDVTDFFTFTILRNPVDRVLSMYFYLRDPQRLSKQNFSHTPSEIVDSLKRLQTMSFNEFLTSDDPINLRRLKSAYGNLCRKKPYDAQHNASVEQCISDINQHYDYIGTVETLDEDMEYVRQHCFPEYEKSFVGTRFNTSRKNYDDISLDYDGIRRLHELLAFDIAVYERVLALRAEKLSRSGN